MKYECSVRQLALEIENVYNELRREKEDYPLEETDVLEIKKAVLAENSSLSPRKLVSFDKEDPDKEQFDSVTFPELPDRSLSIIMEPKDELVLIALGGLLNLSLSNSGVYNSHSFSYSGECRNEKDFCGTVVGWGKVELLLLIDLSPSLITFSRSRLLTLWESVVKDPFLLRLISSFLDLPTLDNTGTDLSSKRGIHGGYLFSQKFCLISISIPWIEPLKPAFLLLFKYARFGSQIFIPGRIERFFCTRIFQFLD